jgi:hypothetical protein
VDIRAARVPNLETVQPMPIGSSLSPINAFSREANAQLTTVAQGLSSPTSPSSLVSGRHRAISAPRSRGCC